MTAFGTPVLAEWVDPDGELIQDSLARAMDRIPPCLPVRAIPRSRRGGGIRVSAITPLSPSPVHCESMHERAWLLRMEANADGHDVVSVYAQPIRIHGRDNQGKWSHVPDFLTVSVNNAKTLIDVTHPGKQDEPDIVRTVDRTRQAAMAAGVIYRQLIGLPADHAALEILGAFRAERYAPDDLTALIARHTKTSISYGDLIGRMDVRGGPAAVQHLMFTGALWWDRTAPLSSETRLKWSGQA